MKDLEGKLRLKARNELLKWLHKPHENAELSDFEQGFLECAKMIEPLVKALDECSKYQWEHLIAEPTLQEFKEELEK